MSSLTERPVLQDVPNPPQPEGTPPGRRRRLISWMGPLAAAGLVLAVTSDRCSSRDPSPPLVTPAAPVIERLVAKLLASHPSAPEVTWDQCLDARSLRRPGDPGGQGTRLIGVEVARAGTSGPHAVAHGFRLQGVSRGTSSLHNVRVERGGLVGEEVGPDGKKAEIRGDAWKGVELKGRLRCPAPGELFIETRAQITEVTPDKPRAGEPATSSPHTWRYTVEILGPDKTWVPACREENQRAIPVAGVWDEKSGRHSEDAGMFSFACEDAVVAKCYQHWGYRPWEAIEGQPPGAAAELHAACTRMARADYCGDGQPHTRDGTMVLVSDNLGQVIGRRPESGDPGYRFEAGWTSKGALCLEHPRWEDLAPGPSCNVPVCGSADEAAKLAPPGTAVVFNESCSPSKPCVK